ncbi:MAG TPA: GNAT family N-acetyltransferase, partial [Caulifigura sp.]|nr:GNAT family N-acetyltransferase [Caulifigura sp.]
MLHQLRTERLLLRPWRPQDREPFARMNADPRVMEFFPALMTPEESDASVDRAEAHFAAHGFGVWAV